MPIEIRERAIFIADAHYPHHGETLLDILNKIENKTIKTTQLFLMGDIFDLLFGYNSYIKTFSQKAIDTINRLSKEIEIIYIEGNHDFCLKEIFSNVKVYKREEQPIKFKLNNKIIYLSHGDKYGAGVIYNIYSKLIRNRITLTILRPFEKSIIDHRMGKLKVKKICGEFKNYQKRFNRIILNYPKDAIIIEGHFHQGLNYKSYISLPSLVCQQQIGIIENGKLEFLHIKNNHTLTE